MTLLDPGFDWSSYVGRGFIPHYREHGSDRGYYQHINRGEYACDECLAAHSVTHRSPAQREEFARLRAANVNACAAAVLTEVPHLRARRSPRRTWSAHREDTRSA